MTTQELFNEFLEKVVNLNPDRVNRMKEAQRILSDFISNHSDFKDLFIDSIEQGSARQKTIIKPTGEDGTFDVDLMIRLKKHSSWSPKQYLEKLAEAFKSSGRYSDITDTYGKTRCVTIDYEGDFHVDLVPAVLQDDGSFSICNKSTDKFEITDGDGYAKWFEQCDFNAKNYLVPIVRLIKFLRDDKGEFNTKSIILTTIAANQITASEAVAGSYKDIPNALTSVLRKMDEYLSANDEPPAIVNPAMPGENFNRHWKSDKEGYKKFKAAIKDYAKKATAANQATEIEESIKLWKKLFGDKFGNGYSNTSSSNSGNKYAVPFTPKSPWGI
jgi:hypothetical protein